MCRSGRETDSLPVLLCLLLATVQLWAVPAAAVPVALAGGGDEGGVARLLAHWASVVDHVLRPAVLRAQSDGSDGGILCLPLLDGDWLSLLRLPVATDRDSEGEDKDSEDGDRTRPWFYQTETIAASGGRSCWLPLDGAASVAEAADEVVHAAEAQGGLTEAEAAMDEADELLAAREGPRGEQDIAEGLADLREAIADNREDVAEAASRGAHDIVTESFRCDDEQLAVALADNSGAHHSSLLAGDLGRLLEAIGRLVLTDGMVLDSSVVGSLRHKYVLRRAVRSRTPHPMTIIVRPKHSWHIASVDGDPIDESRINLMRDGTPEVRTVATILSLASSAYVSPAPGIRINSSVCHKIAKNEEKRLKAEAKAKKMDATVVVEAKKTKADVEWEANDTEEDKERKERERDENGYAA